MSSLSRVHRQRQKGDETDGNRSQPTPSASSSPPSPRRTSGPSTQYDLPAVLEHFAEDATLTVQTAGVTFTGHDEIGRMFTDFFADWDSMVHEITNIVVDPIASKVSTEQLVDLNRNGTTKMHNCNFFDVGSDGQVQPRDHLDGRHEPC